MNCYDAVCSQRHFAVFSLPGPEDESLKTIVNSILESSMTQADHPGLDIELHNGIVQASVKMLTAIKTVLKPSPMPGRTLYSFTLKGIVTCFQVSSLPVLSGRPTKRNERKRNASKTQPLIHIRRKHNLRFGTKIYLSENSTTKPDNRTKA